MPHNTGNILFRQEGDRVEMWLSNKFRETSF